MVLGRAAAQGREYFAERESLERKIECFLNTCLEVTNRPISEVCRDKRIEDFSRNVLLIVRLQCLQPYATGVAICCTAPVTG